LPSANACVDGRGQPASGLANQSGVGIEHHSQCDVERIADGELRDTRLVLVNEHLAGCRNAVARWSEPVFESGCGAGRTRYALPSLAGRNRADWIRKVSRARGNKFTWISAPDWSVGSFGWATLALTPVSASFLFIPALDTEVLSRTE